MTSTPNHPVMTPERSRELVEVRLSSEFDELELEATGIHPRYARFMNTLRGLGEKGGKRMRPYMAMLAFEAYSGQSGEKILPAAVSLELLHLSMLIHDDIIDRDTVRYGMPNVTGAHMDHYQASVPDLSDRRHFADGAAILAGDLMQSHAYYLNEQTEASPEAKQEVRRVMRATSASVIAGELLDTEASFGDSDDISVETIARHKTASYTFVSPLLVGATYAEAPQAEKDTLRAIAEDIGIAFQYRDDIIGSFGNPKKTGKSNEGDIREGKRTILTEVFADKAPEYRKGPFAEAWGNADATKKQVDFARRLLDVYARPIVEGQLRVASERITERIAELNISPEHASAFRKLATQSIKRSI